MKKNPIKEINLDCPECGGKIEIVNIGTDIIKDMVAINIRCIDCGFKYPPLLFPKFTEVSHLLWKSLYKIIKDFKINELQL